MPYFLAVDVGGTKTDYALVDNQVVVARLRSGSIKRMRVDERTAADNLDGALRDLAAQTGVKLSEISRTCVGTAGETVPLVTDWLRREIPARVGGELLVLGDVEIALDAAFYGEPGVIVLAGTGSNLAGRSRSGELFKIGGWGPVLGDQGSGHWIGFSALRAVCLAWDEGEQPELLSSILDFWKLDSFYDLVAFANATPAPDFAQLVPLVAYCADHGDAVAQAVLDEQGRDLAHLVCLLIDRLRVSARDSTFTPKLAFVGSIMEKVHRVRHALLKAVQENYPDVTGAPGVVDPLEGAMWHARSGAGFRSAK